MICLDLAHISVQHPCALQGGFAARRALFGGVLGLGNCDGKQLLKQLNKYGFSHQDVAAALETVRNTFDKPPLAS